jgi:hypothetical protein
MEGYIQSISKHNLRKVAFTAYSFPLLKRKPSWIVPSWAKWQFYNLCVHLLSCAIWSQKNPKCVLYDLLLLSSPNGSLKGNAMHGKWYIDSKGESIFRFEWMEIECQMHIKTHTPCASPSHIFISSLNPIAQINKIITLSIWTNTLFMIRPYFLPQFLNPLL